MSPTSNPPSLAHCSCQPECCLTAAVFTLPLCKSVSVNSMKVSNVSHPRTAQRCSERFCSGDSGRIGDLDSLNLPSSSYFLHSIASSPIVKFSYSTVATLHNCDWSLLMRLITGSLEGQEDKAVSPSNLERITLAVSIFPRYSPQSPFIVCQVVGLSLSHMCFASWSYALLTSMLVIYLFIFVSFCVNISVCTVENPQIFASLHQETLMISCWNICLPSL